LGRRILFSFAVPSHQALKKESHEPQKKFFLHVIWSKARNLEALTNEKNIFLPAVEMTDARLPTFYRVHQLDYVLKGNSWASVKKGVPAFSIDRATA
jgi:hypothetical protein